MAFFDWGNKPISSTQAPASNPTTATLLAELDSTQLGPMMNGSVSTAAGAHNALGRVTAILGGSTVADWRIERTLSTGLGSTAIQETVPLFTPSGQSGQYVFVREFQPGDRLRARVASSLTANVNAFLQVEPLT
mgnify:CR=1 FL=1